jgi:hypothetical protein
MRRALSIAILVLQVSALLWGALPQALYAMYPAMFAAHCVNKAKPAMHCNGKCQMRKATAALVGAATGQSLREDIPVRADMPCIAPGEADPAIAPFAHAPTSRIHDRGQDLRSAPDLPPPRTA